jgi:hypothetical protein
VQPIADFSAGLRHLKDAEKRGHRVVLEADTETAEVVRLFLQIAQDGDLPQKIDTDVVSRLAEVVDLTHHWDSPGVRNTLWAVLHRRVCDRQCEGAFARIFNFAACNQQGALCTSVLRCHPKNYWIPPTETQWTGQAVGGASCWDVGRTSLALLRGMPQQYIWALARAYDEAGKMEGGLEKHLANSFDRYLAVAMGPTWDMKW